MVLATSMMPDIWGDPKPAKRHQLGDRNGPPQPHICFERVTIDLRRHPQNYHYARNTVQTNGRDHRKWRG